MTWSDNFIFVASKCIFAFTTHFKFYSTICYTTGINECKYMYMCCLNYPDSHSSVVAMIQSDQRDERLAPCFVCIAVCIRARLAHCLIMTTSPLWLNSLNSDLKKAKQAKREVRFFVLFFVIFLCYSHGDESWSPSEWTVKNSLSSYISILNTLTCSRRTYPWFSSSMQLQFSSGSNICNTLCWKKPILTTILYCIHLTSFSCSCHFQVFLYVFRISIFSLSFQQMHKS